MATVSADDRRAFAVWLRTGRLPSVRRADGLEFKFNPYHDPRNGRFTFAPGMPRAPEASYASIRPKALGSSNSGTGGGEGISEATPPALRTAPAIGQAAAAWLAAAPQQSVIGRGSNMRAFEDPMTLEQSFPGLRHAPGGAVIAVADNLFDLTGPANVMTAEVLQDQARQL